MHPTLIRVPLPWGGGFDIRSYGFMIMCGFLLALYVGRRRAVQIGICPTDVVDAAVTALIAGVAGARIFYVIVNWESFQSNLAEIVRIDHGGLIFYGGLLGGAGALLCFVYFKRLPLNRMLDLCASIVPLAHALGRVGCFLNGCCYGRVTDAIVGVRFPRVVGPLPGGGEGVVGSPAYLDHLHSGLVMQTQEWSLAVHPTQLYEVGYNLAIFGVLSFVFQHRRREGDVACLYAIMYGSARFVNEFFRAEPDILLGLTIAQIICVPLVLLGVVMLGRSLSRERQPLPEPWRELPPGHSCGEKREQKPRKARKE
jgi:phosphatidylglycerol:prolipoprotein diacylglycerol transferase